MPCRPVIWAEAGYRSKSGPERGTPAPDSPTARPSAGDLTPRGGWDWGMSPTAATSQGRWGTISPLSTSGRVVEQSASFQILHERPSGSINLFRLSANVAGEVAVVVPAAVEDLDKANVPFDHAAGE